MKSNIIVLVFVIGILLVGIPGQSLAISGNNTDTPGDMDGNLSIQKNDKVAVKKKPMPSKSKRNESIEVKKFKTKYGPNWTVKWHGDRNIPRRISGKHDLGRVIKDKDDAEAVAKEIITDSKDLLGIDDIADLKLKRVYEDKFGFIIEYEQLYKGIPVYRGEVRITLGKNIFEGIGNNFYPDINISTTPKITREEAVRVAVQNTKLNLTANQTSEITNSTYLYIVPISNENKTVYHLTWRVTFKGAYFFIDAYDGKIVYKEYTVFPVTVQGKVVGKIYPDRGGATGETEYTRDFKNLFVEFWDDDALATDDFITSSTTNSTGGYSASFDTANWDPLPDPEADVYLKSYLNGTHVDVQHIDPYFGTSRPEEYYYWGHMTGSYVYNFEWENTPDSNVYYSIDRGWKWFKDNFGHDEDKVTAYVPTVDCPQCIYPNWTSAIAWAYGNKHEIHWNVSELDYATYSDTVLHEYGHVVMASIYRPSDVAVSEGWPSYFAASINDDAQFAKDWNIDNPSSTLGDAYHFAAALWDIRKAFIAEHGKADGVAKANDLIWKATRENPDNTSAFFDELLTADDILWGNSDPLDGTPHAYEIWKAFYDHGMDYDAVITLDHDSPLYGELNATTDPDDVFRLDKLSGKFAVVGIRPSYGTDFDLRLYSNPGPTTFVASSLKSDDRVDFVVLDDSEASGDYYAEVSRYNGEGVYYIEMENDPASLTLGQQSGSFGYYEVLDVYQIYLTGGIEYDFTVIPTPGFGGDVGIYLYSTTGGSSSELISSVSGGADATESFTYTPSSSGYYAFVVTNENPGYYGSYDYSVIVTSACDDTQAPPAPSSITVPSTSDTGSYTVSWSGVIDVGCSGLSHYELQESTSPDFTVFTTYTTSSTSYLLTERQDGTYYYRVRGIDLAGNSGLWSGIASVTVQRTSSTQIPPIITLPWMRVDDFSDEPVKRITDGGQAIGDWVYSELDDGTDNYVEKLSTFGGRDGVIHFYWGDTYSNNRNIQKIEKVSVYGWDFSYPPGGSLKVLVNDQSSGANYVNVRLTDASGRVSEAGALTTVNSGWQLFKFKRSDFYSVNLQGLSVTQLNRKELLALSNPDNDSVALFISDTGFDWSDIRRVHVIIEQAGSDVETRDIYIDDIAWELPADLRADTYVTSPGKNVTLTIHAINIYNDTLFLDFYIDGRLIDTVENPGTGNVYSRRLVVSHAIPGNYTHTGRVVYVRDGVGDEVFNTNPSTIAVIDTGPPEVQILNPEQDVIYNTSTIHATWSGSDAESGIDHYEVRIDSSPWQNLGNATTYTLSNLTDGVHSLTVKAVDFGGNTATTTSVFWVNTLPPALTLQSPQNLTYPSGSIPLSYSVADAVGIAWVGYSLDSGQNITLRGNTTLSGVSSGPHTLTLYARDRGGYLSHVTVQFSVPYPYIAQSYTTKAEPAVGDTLNISVVLRNPSGAPYSGRVEGSVWLPDGTGEYLGIKKVQIPADGEYTLAFPYSVTNPGTHDYDIYLEPEDGNWQSSISKIYTTAAFRGVGGVEVLSDGFSTGAPSWQTPEWQVSEGAYLGTTFNSIISYYPTVPLDNLTYEVQIKPNLPWGTAGMVFRYRNEKNFYLFTVYPGEGMSRLWSVVNGTWYLLNQTGYPFTNKWYTLRIEVKGSSVRCYINGTQIMEFSGLSSHPSGMVGLRVRDSSAFFDNIKLSDGEGAPVFYEPFTSGAPYWQTLQWTVNNGVYTGNATDNPAISYSSTYNGDNMSYEVTLRITNIKPGANPTAGIVFRYTNEKNYYLLTLYPESSAIKLWNVINGNWYLLSERPYPVSDNTNFRIRLEVAGSRVRAFISDGVTYTEPVLDYKNLNSHTKGRVGLRVRDAVVEFDNVTVMKW